jgi:cytochrome bd-type quinol oxidase subunit 1
MRPAFSSTRQAVAFSVLLATIMVLPAVAALTGWFKIEGRYPYVSGNFGGFPTTQQEIFVNTNAVPSGGG